FATGRMHCQLEGRLDCLSSAVGKMRTSWAGNRRDRIECFSQVRHLSVVVIGAAYVYELRGLILNCFDDFGVAMPRRAHCHAGVAIQENIAIDIFDPDTLRAL